MQIATVIGAECVVGHLAHLEGCVVEDRCLVGSGSIVLARARIRTGAVVGAAALVPEGMDVPAYALQAVRDAVQLYRERGAVAQAA